MYIAKAIYENVGPIDRIDIDFPLDNNGNPKPIIFVGENGSGKSTVLSNIVDAFYEMAAKEYNNACHTDGASGHQFFKVIVPYQIKTNKKYMLTYLSFVEENEIEYICKSGEITTADIKNHIPVKEFSIPDNQNNNYKNVFIEKDYVEKIWGTNVICYFCPDRYERPSWMGNKYYQLEDYMHCKIEQKFRGYLSKPISVLNVTASNLQWLLDLIADSRADILESDGELSIEHVSVSDLLLLRQARSNIEKILSTILGEDIYFALNFRNTGGSRFKIVRRKDDTVVCPTLDSLSTGQSALFNLFSTIVRYADSDDINRSIQLSDIQGIVVIDEIELHLHSKLQKEVVPKLMNLFPKVQFIITTHSPLFLLGMEDNYGQDGFNIYQMPDATLIDVEEFSEFKRAYNYFCCTTTFKEKLSVEIKKDTDIPLIVTEGSTDWKHIKAAYNRLKTDERYSSLFANFDFELYKYESCDSDNSIDMGNSNLCNACKGVAKIPNRRKIVFVADRDHKETNRILGGNDRYKNWGNNVYSLILPLPEHRKDTPFICIEHYYSDEEIKTESEENGVKRRLFLGNEFDSRGVSTDLGLICEKKSICGPNSIHIIDGTEEQRVTRINQNDGINYALPKAKFAQYVLNSEGDFANFDFSNFIALFETLKEIVVK